VDAGALSRESAFLDGAIARCGFEGVSRVSSTVTFRGGASAGIGSSEDDLLRRDVLTALDKIRSLVCAELVSCFVAHGFSSFVITVHLSGMLRRISRWTAAL
jgi:hypothetical protein